MRWSAEEERKLLELRKQGKPCVRSRRGSGAPKHLCEGRLRVNCGSSDGEALAFEIISQAPEERVAELALRGLRSVLDLSKQLGLNPDALVGDATSERLGLADQHREFLPKISGRRLVKPVIHLSRVNQLVALSTM